ncbi:hypothetical protein [Pseudomonas sp. UMAB-40]|uniref:hypothetical protein n=1 Tax=Pseudomonas sp. UMAB-40 TaxID=1365407 RepID=UPI001C55C496|nr:hypothetical protein [Pseudomonas sp. UMAB-40]
MITAEYIYPAEPLDHKRAYFEIGIKRIAVERFDYSRNDALLKSLIERNRNGRYAVEWVRGAWEGFNMAQTPFVVIDEFRAPVCQTCGDDGYIAEPRTPGIDCPDCTSPE